MDQSEHHDGPHEHYCPECGLRFSCENHCPKSGDQPFCRACAQGLTPQEGF